ncbi:hypothetical protein EHS86_14300 [Erwinia amylovora]|uniref:Uncharacterized protein n=2 Tax=Erwinia amylovora TaxID=552 RepID=A0A831A3X5_ERWAM|nr:hypothetical protein AD997_10120 [Erwinia amylovora]EKV54754.1 hypothetical protein EaACW_2060 [Erwinia amylovora ACW56400]CBA20998.1 hypothetical protein predicted by Glimmer/Critica [Erwinia amylovora CFBP1430]CCO78905.1 hypothetical protein BN432_2110 [Erwinia amylovora Ea356]CCO82703.1 hypothetical protein BN433_2135 [Erwinia amylovora Ea266]CCO90270.1 hypothetical protein BN435_2102 [Erwinia amylovora 01SFR-BO]CCO94033.1 hypothetical protein BN437_2106 [Erwinia amylovora NBRC 12687 = 
MTSPYVAARNPGDSSQPFKVRSDLQAPGEALAIPQDVRGSIKHDIRNEITGWLSDGGTGNNAGSSC